MFEPIKGGHIEEIETLKLQKAILPCWVPPPPIDDKLILFSDQAKEDQYWRRTPLPDWWDEVLEFERRKKETNPSYVEPKAQIFRNQEWLRRLNGVHFLNNGVLTYLTGPTYYYLNWWRSDHPVNDGYPIYYDEIRKRFYFRQYCAEDPKCLGYILTLPRGGGKTVEETCVMTENITRGPRKRKAVIQSKSEDDAKRVFTEKIQPAYNDLPEFFKPISNHGSMSQKMLSFFRDAVRGKNAKNITYKEEDELQNTLIYAPAKEKQLSGQNIADLLNDEMGVTDPKKEADVYIRSQVNRFCVYRNNIKIGLFRGTTTVEEMDKGGAEFKKVWDESDITKRTANGFTVSGFYRYCGNDLDVSIQFADKYGIIDKAKARAFHDAEREARKNDSMALNSYIRKNPRDESEMFTKKANQCHFDAQSLTSRLKVITSSNGRDKPYRQGMFTWKGGEKNTSVIWEPCAHDEGTFVQDPDTYEMMCPRCRYLININTFPDEKERNAVEVEHFGNITNYKPKNQLKWTAGADPYENSIIVDEAKGSNAALYIKRKFDYLIDGDKPEFQQVTNAPALEYLYRPGDVYEMYDDIVKAIWFFGCEVLPEANKIGLQRYLEDFYPFFLIKRPKGLTARDVDGKTEGLRSSTPIITAYTDAIEYDVRYNVHKYPFPRQIYQLLNFNNLETTKFDAAVAWGFTLLGQEKKVVENPIPVNLKFYREYDRYGREIR